MSLIEQEIRRRRAELRQTDQEPPDDRAGSNHSATANAVRLVRASSVRVEPVRWAIEPTVPLGTVTGLVGKGGLGKSTITCEWGARASRGQLAGDLTEPSDVVIVSVEDHPGRVLVPRLTACGADLTRVHFVEVDRDGMTGDLVLPDDLASLDAALDSHDVRLMILDPIVALFPGTVNAHRQQDVRRVIAELKRRAEERDLAVIAIMHMNKMPSIDAGDRVSGSHAFRDSFRSLLVVGPDPNDEHGRVLAHDKTNNGVLAPARSYRIEGVNITAADGATVETSRVVWGGTLDLAASDLLAGPVDDDARSERDEAADFLRQILEDGPRSAADVKRAANAEGIAERTLHRARRALGVKVERQGFPASSTWTLAVVPPTDGTTRRGTTGDRGTTVQAQGLPGSDSPAVPQLCHTRGHGTTAEAHPDEWLREQLAAIPADDPEHGLRVAQVRAEAVRRKHAAPEPSITEDRALELLTTTFDALVETEEA